MKGLHRFLNVLIGMTILQEYVVFSKTNLTSEFFFFFFSEHLLTSHRTLVVCATQFRKHQCRIIYTSVAAKN